MTIRPCDRIPWMDELRPSAPIPLVGLEDEAALVTFSAWLRANAPDMGALDHYETDLTLYPEYGSMGS